MIPEEAGGKSLAAAKKSEAVLCIGTTGEVMPAAMIPQIAKNNGAKIIEINTEPTMLTANLTDIFLQGKASEVLPKLTKIISEKGSKE
jgi:NAD-dependent deacetylase